MTEVVRTAEPNKSQAVLIFIFCSTMAILSWWMLTDQRHNDLRHDLKTHAEVSSNYITNDLENRIPALKRIIYRWEKQNRYTKLGFISDARHYIHDIPGFSSINWVDENNIIRWVAPSQGNEGLVGQYLAKNDAYKHFLSEAKYSNDPVIPLELEENLQRLPIYFPIRVRGRAHGFLLVILNTEDWLKFVFHRDRFKDDAKNYDVAVRFSGKLIFKTEGFTEDERTQWIVKSETTVLRHNLEIMVQPTPQFFNNGNQFTAELVMVVLFLFGGILASLSYYLKKIAKISRQVRRANQILAKESGERLRAEKEAKSANEAKTKFLAAMSHEIRTPLNAVLGILQIVERSDLPQDTSDKLKIARESGFFLLTLVNQVLDFARIEAGSVERFNEEFTVDALVSNLHSMFKLQAEKKNIRFEYKVVGPGELWINGDYSHTKQVLFNLIGNAIKFTNTGSVTILARILENEFNRVNLTFEVIDTGPGISDEEQSLIFEEFKQSDSGKRSGMGTGLGLSISKQLADVMCGELTVSSEVNKGTIFKFVVDVDRVDTPAVQLIAAKPAFEISSLQILVAEDNTVNQMIVEDMLCADGHKVTVVDDGAEALNIVQNNPNKFDLILMDIQMPNMNGVEATKAIRSQILSSDELPIFALTANAFKSQVDEYLSVGMQGALTKPIVHDDLRAMLDRYFSKHPEKIRTNKKEIPVNTRDKNPDYLDRKAVKALKEIMPKNRYSSMISSLGASFKSDLADIMSENLEPNEEQALLHRFRGMISNVGLVYLAQKVEEIEVLSREGKDTLKMRRSLENIANDSLAELSKFNNDNEGEETELLSS